MLGMKKYIFALLFVAAFFSINPFLSQAETDVDTSGGASCADIQYNLRYGMRDAASNGNSVSILQDFLYSNGFLTLQPTGFFGSLTRTAVSAFQNKYSIQATPPGFVGSQTRAQIKEIDCGGGGVTSPAPVWTSTVSLKAEPTSIVSDGKPRTVMLSWSSTNAKICTLSSAPYNSLWRDQTDASGSVSVPISQTTTFSIVCGSSSSSDKSAKQSVTVKFSYSTQLAPAISSVASKAADKGTVYAGERAYIYGTNLNEVTAVTIAGISVKPSAVGFESSVEFMVPPSLSAGSAQVSVTNSAGVSSQPYMVTVLSTTVPVPTFPTITSIYPSHAPSGTSVTIYGSGFSVSNTVTLDGLSSVTGYSSNSTSLTFTVPSLPVACTASYPTQSCTSASGTYKVYVSNVTGRSNTLPFTIDASTNTGVKTTSYAPDNQAQVAQVLQALEATLRELSNSLQ